MCEYVCVCVCARACVRACAPTYIPAHVRACLYMHVFCVGLYISTSHMIVSNTFYNLSIHEAVHCILY